MTSNKKIIAVVHLYYKDMWPQIKEHLDSISDYAYDLVVSMPKENSSIKETILSFKNDTVFVESENVGYDIWPFVKVLKNINLDDYDYLVKLHTKRDMGKIVAIIDNKYFFRGAKWREFLLSFVKDKKTFNTCISAFENDKTLGMVNNKRLFDTTSLKSKDPHQKFCLNKAKELLKENANLIAQPDSYVKYVAGTMFICRASLLKPLLKMNIGIDNFSTADRKNENDLAHVVERLFGWTITSQGFKIADPFSTFSDDLKNMPHSILCRIVTFPIRHRLVSKIFRFIFRIDKNEKVVCYRLFKVTIFRKKI